jgi:flagellar hook-length control protein FliK
MEISSGYTTKTIPKADNANNGKVAKEDNFADLLSNIVDNSRSLPAEDAKPSENSADNNKQDDAQNQVDEQNTAANDETIVVPSEKSEVKSDTPADDTTEKPVDAQQAILSLILNQAQKPTTDVAVNSAPTDTSKAFDTLETANNPALIAALAQNGETKTTDLNGAIANKTGMKSQSIGDSKFDLTLDKYSENNIAEDAVASDASTNASQNDNHANKDISNLLAKNNFAVHQQAQGSENSTKTQDVTSLTATSLSSADNNSTATTGDINKSAVDQNNSIRINLDNIQSLAAIMVRKHFGGEKSFTIRLDPPELGEIKVELKIDKDKKAKAIISASNQDALGDLTKSVKDLAQSLKDGGIDINEEDFEFNLNNQSDDNEFAQNAKSQSNDNSTEKTASEDVQPETTNQINRGINRTQVWHNVRVSLIA